MKRIRICCQESVRASQILHPDKKIKKGVRLERCALSHASVCVQGGFEKSLGGVWVCLGMCFAKFAGG